MLLHAVLCVRCCFLYPSLSLSLSFALTLRSSLVYCLLFVPVENCRFSKYAFVICVWTPNNFIYTKLIEMLITFVSLLTHILCVCSFQWSQILIIFHVIKFCPSLNQLCVIYRESFHLDDWLNFNWDDKTKSLCDSRFQKSSISPAFTHGKEWFSWFLIGSRHHFYRKYTMTDPIENTKYLQSRAMPNDGSVCVCVCDISDHCWYLVTLSIYAICVLITSALLLGVVISSKPKQK